MSTGWEEDGYCGSFAMDAVDIECAFVKLHQGFADREAQPCTFSREKSIGRDLTEPL